MQKPPPPEAFASAVPKETREYVKSLVHHSLAAQAKASDKDAKTTINELQSKVDDLNQKLDTFIELLEQVKSYHEADQKYVLTRQKIIDFMKKAGIY